jgi:hypothetical protein
VSVTVIVVLFTVGMDRGMQGIGIMGIEGMSWVWREWI